MTFSTDAYDYNDEAIEARLNDDESDRQASSEGEGDNLSDNLSKDYEQKPELDRYEEDGIDDMEQSIIDAD